MPRLRGHTHEKSGLYYFGARYYSPEIGRWTQRDPVGEADDLNLYLYVGDDPVGSMDMWGLEKTHGWFWYFVFFSRSPHEERTTGPSPYYYRAINDPVGEYRAQLDSDVRWGHNAAKDFREKCLCIGAQLTIVHVVRGTPQGEAAFERAKKCIKWNKLKRLEEWDVKKTSTTVSQMVGWAYTNDPAETKIVVYHEVYRYGKLIHRDIKSTVCGCVRYVFHKPPKH
jgi:RHS repeat-associated protein